VGFNPLAEAGYPDVECPVVFLQGCNLRCPYCLNASIVVPHGSLKEIAFDEVVAKVRRLGSQHILISGGEPTWNPRIQELVDAFREEGLKVRLSTNGTFPSVLKSVLASGGVSFVAMDIKTSYSADFWKRFPIIAPGVGGGSLAEMSSRVMSSHHLLEMRADEDPSFDFEVRTTLFPPLVDMDAVKSISKLLKPGTRWVLQQFRPKAGLIDPAAEHVRPYDAATVEAMLSAAREAGMDASVRYP